MGSLRRNWREALSSHLLQCMPGAAKTTTKVSCDRWNVTDTHGDNEIITANPGVPAAAAAIPDVSIADAPPATYDAASALCQRSLGGHSCGGGRPFQPPPTAHGRRKGAPAAHEGTLPPTRRPSPAPLAAGIGRLRDWEQWPVRDSSSRRRRCRHEVYWPRAARGEYREETGDCVSCAARLHAGRLATTRVGEEPCKYFFSRNVTLLGSVCVCFVSVFDCVVS